MQKGAKTLKVEEKNSVENKKCLFFNIQQKILTDIWHQFGFWDLLGTSYAPVSKIMSVKYYLDLSMQ